MYSPKIREDLVARLFQAAKKEHKPMTKIVDQILRKELDKMPVEAIPISKIKGSQKPS